MCKQTELPSCFVSASQMSAEARRQLFDRLCMVRLERKAANVKARFERCNRDWEHAFFITLARAFGFGINSDTFERWAFSIPYSGVAKHRDNLAQVLAIFLGQAGFLAPDFLYGKPQSAALKDFDTALLQGEYKFLATKFSLTPIEGSVWHFSGARPYNFPTARIARFARLYSAGNIRFSAVVDAIMASDTCALLCKDGLSANTANLLVLNAMVPTLYAYGSYKGLPRLCDKALRWLSELPAENNKHTRLWAQTSLPLINALESQAILQLLSEK